MHYIYYAGIGSRFGVPTDIIKLMTKFANILNTKGYILRSGGAEGSDTAFENGAGEEKEILRPKHATAIAIKMAMDVHPASHNCSPYVKKLHGRNAQIILGKHLNSPVDFVICWTKTESKGGTSLGIKLAKKNNIKVYNLFNQNDRLELKERFLDEDKA